MKRRVLSFILVLCMICTLLPVGVFAASVVNSGYCGDNLTWTLDSNGALTISGTGGMYDYTAYNSTKAPWYNNSDNIKNVIIKDGVTSIGDSAFGYCRNLATVTIGKTVKNIGKRAFYCCTSLACVTLPSSVANIDDEAFYYCYSMNRVTIPDGVTNIGEGAFYECYALTEVTIPNSVKSIGKKAFYDCHSIEIVNVGTGVTSIGEYAFGLCDKLTGITIPDGVTEIAEGLFYGCDSLASVTMGNSVTSIGAAAFYECDSLECLTIPDSVVSIGGGAFRYCDNLTSVILGSGMKEIGEVAFENCKSLTSVVVPNGVTSIGDVAFGWCEKLADVTIPKSVTKIGHGAFYYCTSLRDVAFGGSEAEWTNLGVDFDNCNPRIHYSCPSLDGHYVPVEVKAATCEDSGYTEYSCDCGYSHVGDYVDALGHDYKDGVCTRCGAKDPNYNPSIKENPFVDVKEGSVYYDAILWAYYHTPQQITGGFTATEFRPGNPCTRAQVVTFLWRAKGCPEPTSSNNPFSDVSVKQSNGKDNPYYKAILWAAEEGITTGYVGGLFKPNDTVTRAQFVTFLWRADGKPATGGSINGFADAASIATPYQQAVAWAVERGITTGYEDNTFRPNAACTRWAVVLFMYRDMAY